MILKQMVRAFLFVFLNGLCFGNEPVFLEKNDADSVKVYYDLIAEESYNADYKPNATGMIVGGSLTGIGLVLVGLGIYELSILPENPKTLNSSAGGFLGTFCILGSIPFLSIGVPVLSYNIYQYHVRKKHAHKRDAYQNALERYKLRKNDDGAESFRVILFPLLNIDNGSGGIKTLFSF